MQLSDAPISAMISEGPIEGKVSIHPGLGHLVVEVQDDLKIKFVEALVGKNVEFSLKSPYLVPVRGDNRYAAVASILVESHGMQEIRAELGFAEPYSQGRPPRYTFAAVRNHYLPDDDETLVAKMRSCLKVNGWLTLRV